MLLFSESTILKLFLEVNNIAIRREDSFEYKRDKIREAIDSKYKNDRGFGKYDIQLTLPDKVLVQDWDESKFFEIPYTIDDEFNITLEEPTEYDEVWQPKKEIEAKLSAARADDKAVGKIWGPGKHHVFVNDEEGNKKPATVLVKPETIIPTFELIKQKLDNGERIPLGVDHINEDILKQNPILAEMVEESIGDLMDVGEIKEVATDGQAIYMTDSELTNPLIQALYKQGKLPAFSIEGDFKAGECELQDVDYVLDQFNDVTKTDFVKKGGCLDCLVGAQPDELILASKLSMEVDKVTDTNNDGNNTDGNQNPNNDGTGSTDGGDGNQTPGTPGTGVAGTGNPTPGAQGNGSTAEEEFDPIKFKKDLLEDVKGLIQDAQAGNTEKVEAKLGELTVKAKSSEVNRKIEGKIREGTVIPAMKEGLLQAGLAMKPEDFDKHLETYKKELWDPSSHANLEAGQSGDGKFDYKKAKEEAGLR